MMTSLSQMVPGIVREAALIGSLIAIAMGVTVQLQPAKKVVWPNGITPSDVIDKLEDIEEKLDIRWPEGKPDVIDRLDAIESEVELRFDRTRSVSYRTNDWRRSRTVKNPYTCGDWSIGAWEFFRSPVDGKPERR